MWVSIVVIWEGYKYYLICCDYYLVNKYVLEMVEEVMNILLVLYCTKIGTSYYSTLQRAAS